MAIRCTEKLHPKEEQVRAIVKKKKKASSSSCNCKKKMNQNILLKNGAITQFNITNHNNND